MSLYFNHIPSFIQRVYHHRKWRVDTNKKKLYITFDDGPHPTLTTEILDLLSKFHAKVTFFQLGSKVDAYPALHKRCKEDGHTIGNHGYYHLDALKIYHSRFFQNISRGQKVTGSKLFRPAFGRLPIFRKKKIHRANNVVMWDIMPGDFDKNISYNKCIEIIKKNVQNGSIIVLHENDKAADKVIYILKWILEYYSDRGFKFSSL
ncbi:MAG: polysaccharide deacetylase family protein [Saprospiraceae bacterium]